MSEWHTRQRGGRTPAGWCDTFQVFARARLNVRLGLGLPPPCVCDVGAGLVDNSTFDGFADISTYADVSGAVEEDASTAVASGSMLIRREAGRG